MVLASAALNPISSIFPGTSLSKLGPLYLATSTSSFQLGLSFWVQTLFWIFCFGASLVAQWLRIRLPMQGTWVRSLVQEDPTCRGATKPVRHNYWACALEPTSHNYWACEPQLLRLRATTTEACTPRARASQQERPPQREARTPQRRVVPAHHN